MLYIAVSLFSIVSITDYLDGYIARKLHIVSDVGKVLDPLADKILVLTFLPLLEMQTISSFPVFIILAREFAVMALRVVMAKNGTILAASTAGKWKTALTLPLCGVLFARVSVRPADGLLGVFQVLEPIRLWIYHWPRWMIATWIWVVIVVTIWSFLDYFGEFIWNEWVKKMGGDSTVAKRRLRLIIPNAFTILNLVSGISAAGFAILGAVDFAVALVLLGTLLDAIDGRLARKLDAFSNWGAKLDSKADYVTFGIAPAAILAHAIGPNWNWIAGICVAGVYYGAVHYRLVRFNRVGHSPFFDGLPSPIGAMTVVLAMIVPWGRFPVPVVGVGIGIAMAALMVSTIPYPHLEVARHRTILRHFRFPALLTFCCIIIGLLTPVVIPGAPLVLLGMLVIYIGYPLFSDVRKL